MQLSKEERERLVDALVEFDIDCAIDDAISLDIIFRCGVTGYNDRSDDEIIELYREQFNEGYEPPSL